MKERAMFPVAVRTEAIPLKSRDDEQARKNGAEARAAIEREIPDFIERINAIVNSKESEHARIKQLHKLADRVLKAIGHLAPCSSGCSQCCHAAVIIPPQEAEYIGMMIKRRAKQPKQWITSRDGYKRIPFGKSNPCTFLRNNKCSIYEHRPLACRTHVAMTPTAEPCRLDDGQVRETASLDLRIFDDANVCICAALPADIRDYFPPPANKGERR